MREAVIKGAKNSKTYTATMILFRKAEKNDKNVPTVNVPASSKEDKWKLSQSVNKLGRSRTCGSSISAPSTSGSATSSTTTSRQRVVGDKTRGGRQRPP